MPVTWVVVGTGFTQSYNVSVSVAMALYHLNLLPMRAQRPLSPGWRGAAFHARTNRYKHTRSLTHSTRSLCSLSHSLHTSSEDRDLAMVEWLMAHVNNSDLILKRAGKGTALMQLPHALR